MDPQTLQNILLGIIAVEGGVIAYTLLAATKGTTPGGVGPGPSRPTKAFVVAPADSNQSDTDKDK